MSSSLYSGVSGLAIGAGLYKTVSGLWSGASGLTMAFGGAGMTLSLDFTTQTYSANFNSYAFQSLIDFTRTSAATYVDATGKIVPTLASRNLLTFTQEFDNAGWAKTAAVITANSTVAPDGTMTADTLVDDTTSSQHRLNQNGVNLTSGVPYAVSLYAKAGTHNFIQLLVTAGSGTNAWFTVIANLATGAITQTGNGTSGTLTASSITSVGNGWYRIAMTGSAADTSAFRIAMVPAASGNSIGASDGTVTYTGAGTSLFIWGAQLEAVPDANLVLGPELVANGGFDSATGWTLGTGWTISGGVATFDPTGQAANSDIYYTLPSAKDSAAIYDVSANGAFGVILAVTAGGAIKVTGTVSGRTAGTIRILSASGRIYIRALNGTGFNGSIDNISVREITAITGMPTDYTRNFGGVFPPRFDYDPVTLAPKGLLIEEQRTNLLVRSEEFDNASWTKNVVTVTANSAVSPDGTADADTLVPDSGQALAGAFVNQTISKTASAITYTASVYAKASQFNRVRLLVDGGNSANRADATISLVNGSVVTAAATAGTFTSASVSAIPLSNGWFRVALTFTTGTEVTLRNRILAEDSVATTGDGTSGIYLWGAQLEAGAFATSYIPTAASQVTRTADVATITGANFSQWYNQSEGTFVVEGTVYSTGISGNRKSLLAATEGNFNNSVLVGVLSGTTTTGGVRSGGVQQADTSVASAISANTVFKMAFAVKADNFALCVNGGAVATDTSGAMLSNAALLDIGCGPQNSAGSTNTTGDYLNGHLRSLRYYPAKLTNAQLQALTS